MTNSDRDSKVRLVVRLFSVLREETGLRSIEVAVEAPAKVAQVLDRLASDHPAVRPYRRTMRAAVNMEYVDESFAVSDGDEIAVITPVSGG